MRHQEDKGLGLFARCCSALLSTQVALAGMGTSFAFHAQEAVAQANSNEQLADIAKSITVRIEGASTPASGVLIERKGTRYTVLTAWHAVSAQNPEEELAIYTSDGLQHQLKRGSITRVDRLDLAVLTFTSRNSYQIARRNITKPRTGASIYLYGYPAATTSVPMRISRGTPGHIVAASEKQSLNGYELMYSTQMPSMTGMSGGPVLDAEGNLIGIHARSETDQTQAVEDGIAIRTGMSQGIPVSYLSTLRPNETKLTPGPGSNKERRLENENKVQLIGLPSSDSGTSIDRDQMETLRCKLRRAHGLECKD